MTSRRLHGVYAVTDPVLCSATGPGVAVEHALLGGAALVQYRNKQADGVQREREAGELLGICRRYGRPLIINDDLELTLRLQADGVHIGADDGEPRAARAALPAGGLLGVSCYDSLERALEAEKAGADYVAFGSLFASKTKPRARRAPLSLLTEARSRLRVPIVAIGGITLDNAAQVIAAGADCIAVVGGLFDTPDIGSRAAGLAACFDRSHQSTTRRP